MVIKNLIEGAGTLIDWGLLDRCALSTKDFHFIRDDLKAIQADWIAIGNDLYRAVESQAKVEKEGPFLFSPEEFLSPEHGKERKQTR